MLANGIISRVAESQLSKRTWVTKTETGDLNVQGGYLCRIPPFLSKSSMPYANIHNSGQLHKKTFFYFPLILGLMVLFVNAFGKTFHWGQLLLRHFCLRGSSCRQTNSFPKLLFGSLQKRTWLNLEKLFFEWSGKKKKGGFLLDLPSLFLIGWQSWLVFLKVKWEFVSITYLLLIAVRFCARCHQLCSTRWKNKVYFLIDVVCISTSKALTE